MQNGKIGVTTENIFPIIKKFLYSDHDIFLRELIANAVDASQKMKTFASIGEFKGELGELDIQVKLDSEAKTLTISDKGIGMSAEEIDKYINQIAFSGAEEFLEKYKNQSIIGHFGLGFYSAFMVASEVEIITCSFREGAKTMHWRCDGSPEYTLSEAETARTRGTDIILHLSADSEEFAQKDRIEQILKKHCSFLPIPIIFGKKQEWKEGKNVDTEQDNIINSAPALWTKKPAEISEQEYADFYHTLYPMSEDPLFNIHLNIDYPFDLTGILYFPKIRNNFEIQKNKIQLYSNQVFVTDSVEGIVPEFLTLLHGIIDSPDIPLNVSRSYLQSDSNVKKISSYITRKVAERLGEIFKNQRPEFESKWNDLKIFIQYGMITDEKFAEKAEDFVMLKSLDDKYFTLKEYAEVVKENQTDKHGKVIYLYATDKEAQHSFIKAAQAKGYDVLDMDGQLDNHFIGWFENKFPESRMVRVDSNLIEKLIEKESELKMALSSTQQEVLTPVFESQLPTAQGAIYTVSFEAMGADATPVVITQNEFMRRMKEMAATGGAQMAFYGQMPDQYNVMVNGNHPLVAEVLGEVERSYGEKLPEINQKIESLAAEKRTMEELLKDKSEEQIETHEKEAREELSKREEALLGERTAQLKTLGAESKLVKQLIDLALLSNGMLKGEGLTEFIRRSVELIGK